MPNVVTSTCAFGLLYLCVKLQRTDLESGVIASASFPISLLPDERTENFVGHQDLLIDVHRYFKIEEISKDDLKIYSLCGISGVGKTKIAVQYAKSHSSEFDAILWIGSESVGSIQQGFTKAALALGLPGVKVGGDPDHHLTLVHQWLRETDKSWLLIFDNMEKFSHIQRFLPFGCKGSVIITTRYIEQAKPCRRKLSTVEPLSFSDSKVLFMRLLHGIPNAADSEERSTHFDSSMLADEVTAMNYLLTQMGGLVLGIQQIVALIRYQELVDDITKFAEKYRRRPHNIHAKSSGIAGHTLATLWEMSFAAVRQNRSAFILLGIISCLQPDEIPKALFLPDDLARVQGDLSFCADEDDLDDAIDFLRDLALIERRRDKISIHRLVQTAFLFQNGLSQAERQQIFESVSTLVDHAFPAQREGRQMYDQWTGCRTSIAILYVCPQRAGHAVNAPHTFQHLMPACVWHLYECGSERDAPEMVEIAISSSSDKQNLLYAQLLNSAMINYFKLNDISNARRVLEESRAIREKLMDPQNEELAATYANFGSIELAEGNLNAALEYYQRAQKIRVNRVGAEAMQGLDHMCIGRVLFAKGDFEGAVREYRLCEKIYSQFGPDHYLQVRDAFNKGLRVAKLRGDDGSGEIARIIRKQAVILEKRPDSEELHMMAHMRDAEHLRGEAEAILRRLRPNQELDDEDEDKLFDSLVNPFNR
ncbi:P-loop containing nucleoside triphosphate hydrolase protein [Xylaria sp. FL0043]|nr:P-loop containing nucleoside triphosphate hydrolase protein [Xylaria sp. FL0043]